MRLNEAKEMKMMTGHHGIQAFQVTAGIAVGSELFSWLAIKYHFPSKSILIYSNIIFCS